MTRTDRKRAELKWRSGQGKLAPGIRFRSNAPELVALGLTPTPRPAVVGVLCSFCGKDTPKITATHGMSKPRKLLGFDPTGNNDRGTMSPVVGHVASKVVACPNCAGRIKPLIDREGKIAVMNCNTTSTDE